ncbi:MAG: nuclease-related domain-containing protein [Micromonosporaceae bacterium]
MDRVTRPGTGKPESSAPESRDAAEPQAHVAPADDTGQSGPEGGQKGQKRGGRQQRRAGLAAIASNPRLPVWERRIAFSLVAGIIVTFIFNWRIGLTVAVLAVIADTIRSSHTTAALPPVRRGPALRKTERKLDKLASAGYVALHERAIPGSDAIIDHLVVGPSGVYAIDSESWDKRLPVRVLGGKQLFHGPFSRIDRLEEARWEAAQAEELISGNLGRHVEVRPALAIYGPKLPWTVLTVRNVDVFAGDHIRKYLRTSIKKGRGRRLNSGEIERIREAAARVLPEHV